MSNDNNNSIKEKLGDDVLVLETSETTWKWQYNGKTHATVEFKPAEYLYYINFADGSEIDCNSRDGVYDEVIDYIYKNLN